MWRIDVRFLFVYILVALVASVDAQQRLTHLLDIPSRFANPAELRFERGYTIVIDRLGSAFPGPQDDKVSVLNDAGQEIFSRSPGTDLPDARIVTLEHASIDSDGVIAVAVQAWNSAGSLAAALLLYDVSNPRPLRVIRTNPVICLNVAFDFDHSIWCLGPDVDAAKAGRDDYSLLWRYARSGELRSQALARRSLPPGKNPWSRLATLDVDNEGVSAWFPPAESFVRVTADATRIDRLPPPPASIPGESVQLISLAGRRPIMLVVTRGSSQDRSSLYRRFFELDTSGKAWSPLSSAWPELRIGIWPIGRDRDQIVFWDRYQRSLVRLATR